MILHQGKYLDLISEDGWEYVKRTNCSGIVVVVPVTRDGKAILVEQFRRPVRAQVIEWPAGLVNDKTPHDPETMETAARRELLEETGYEAGTLELLVEGPVSSGLSAEIITFYRALEVVKKGAGGGDETESIIVHEVPLPEVASWLVKMEKKGYLVDPKVYAGLYFIKAG
ncbi:MAG TPA: NUDIX hydrolase [Candidatus Omnitrophota bacterium]|nr:NUDIX hydrolase [Candidatus Omnitrophota bacterium]HPS37667.1 NUDIX hydrolase [Candidatus Omnitrophota bacterium]